MAETTQIKTEFTLDDDEIKHIIAMLSEKYGNANFMKVLDIVKSYYVECNYGDEPNIAEMSLEEAFKYSIQHRICEVCYGEFVGLIEELAYHHVRRRTTQYALMWLYHQFERLRYGQTQHITEQEHATMVNLRKRFKFSMEEIADILHRSSKTVWNHLTGRIEGNK